MKVLSIVLLAGLSLMAMSCSSVTIKTDYDREYDFVKFKTYRWAEGKEINPQDELQKYPLVLKRVQAAVTKTLAEKGLQEAKEGEDFDLVVLVHAGSKERMQVHNTGGYGGYGGWYDPWWGPYGGTTTVSYYEEATLVVDLVSWEKKELAWRGIATGTVRENQDAEEQQERLNGIVARIFEEYPPKGN
jgi:hypothetical protein